MDEILATYPQMENQLPENILWELAKLSPAIRRSTNHYPLYYHSADIEKLRIFKAVAFLLQKAHIQGNIPMVKIIGTVDKTSLQFLAYVAAKFPHIRIPIESNST